MPPVPVFITYFYALLTSIFSVSYPEKETHTCQPYGPPDRLWRPVSLVTGIGAGGGGALNKGDMITLLSAVANKSFYRLPQSLVLQKRRRQP